MVLKNRSFSLWLDFIERNYLKSDFKDLLNRGDVIGATSNPTIFANAIKNSKAYAEQLKDLKDKSPKEKYEALAVTDIKTAAKVLRPLYNRGEDGYVSIEVDPTLSNNAEATVAEAKRLFKAIDEPNVMIKIPATEAGFKAMYELMSDGISVNATLVFSPEQAQKSFRAMTKGISKCEADGGCRVEGVISVFVSRFDRKLDETLEKKGITPSKTGIYNASKIYNMVEKNSIPNIRTLFASTSVKGDNLPQDYYVTNLIAPHSINTAPLNTIEAYLKTNNTKDALPISKSEIDNYFDNLEANGIDMQKVYQELLDEGLKAFEDSFAELLETLK
jgi:transaldolase